MNVSPNIAEVAKLVSEPSRAAILTALLDDRFYTASELAGFAGVNSKPQAFILRNWRMRTWSSVRSKEGTIITVLKMRKPPGRWKAFFW